MNEPTQREVEASARNLRQLRAQCALAERGTELRQAEAVFRTALVRVREGVADAKATGMGPDGIYTFLAVDSNAPCKRAVRLILRRAFRMGG